MARTTSRGKFPNADESRASPALRRGESAAWLPNPGPQSFFIECPVEDVLFGGARGGGKTDALLGDFLKHAQAYGPDAKGILFRRTLEPELREVIDRSKVLFGRLGWRYRESPHHDWTAPNGATLRLRYLDVDADADKYQGQQFSWMGFDELGNWPRPEPIDKLWACLRGGHSGVRKARRSTCNPGGVGHVWVRERYRLGAARRHQAMVPFRWAPLASRPDLTIESVFIPSRLEDNPKLLESDPGYEGKLAASSGGSETLFRAWRSGDWDILAGQYFEQWDPVQHVLRRADWGLEPWHPRWISIDWGYAHPTAVLWHAWTGRYVLTYRERMLTKTTAEEIGVLLATTAVEQDEKYDAVYLGRDAFAKVQDEQTMASRIDIGARRVERFSWGAEPVHGPIGPTEMMEWIAEQHAGGVGGEAGRDGVRVDSRQRVPGCSMAVMDRVNGWRAMGDALAGGSWYVAEECRKLIETIPLLTRDPDHPEDVLKVDGIDDACDAARYGLMSRRVDIRRPAEQVVAERVAQAAPQDPTSRAMAIRRAWAEQGRGRHAGEEYAGLGGRRHVR